jgi:hypothetical protein
MSKLKLRDKSMFQGNWETKPKQNVPMVQAKAWYEGEQVEVMEVIGNGSSVQAMINYDGPRWVSIKDLNNITWLVS